PEPARARDDDAADIPADDLELVPLAHRGLVDVPCQDQLRARLDERAQDVIPPRDRLLPRPPRRAEHLMVEDGDAQRAGARVGQPDCRIPELFLTQAPRLLAPPANR